MLPTKEQLREIVRNISNQEKVMREFLDELKSFIKLHGKAIPADKFRTAIKVVDKVYHENEAARKLAAKFKNIEQVDQMTIGFIFSAVESSENYCRIFIDELAEYIEPIVIEAPVIMPGPGAGQEPLIYNNKRGRGKPTGSIKENARRVAIKIRWKDTEIEEVRAAAEAVGEDVSTFIRVAALNRAQDLNSMPG